MSHSSVSDSVLAVAVACSTSYFTDFPQLGKIAQAALHAAVLRQPEYQKLPPQHTAR